MGTPTQTYAQDFNAVMATAARYDVGGKMTFAGAQAILTSAAQGGMTAGKFAALHTLAGEIGSGSTSALQSTATVMQLFDKIVLGTSENTFWTGGGKASATLGNLSAISTQAQASELIGKWFLGTDNPSLAGLQATSYQAQGGPLFASAGPKATDVNQGGCGDCYFEAALASEAYQNPNAIRNMVTSQGNGVFTVDFKLNGRDDYVSVNSAMATLPKGWSYADGSHLACDNGGAAGSIWSEVVEKAYAEFRGDTDACSNSATTPQNSFAHINGGFDNGIVALTGHSTGRIWCDGSVPSSAGATLQAAIAAKDIVTMGTPNVPASSGLIGNHMYAVLGVDAKSGMVTLDNPWNANAGSKGGVSTMSLASLAAQDVVFLYENGPTSTTVSKSPAVSSAGVPGETFKDMMSGLGRQAGHDAALALDHFGLSIGHPVDSMLSFARGGHDTFAHSSATNATMNPLAHLGAAVAEAHAQTFSLGGGHSQRG